MCHQEDDTSNNLLKVLRTAPLHEDYDQQKHGFEKKV